MRLVVVAAILAAVRMLGPEACPGAVTGSISGTLKDPSGLLIPGATLTAVNTAQGIRNKTATYTKGFFSFPSLPVGTYELQVDAPGFRPEKRTGLTVDANGALVVD